jgi:hypothetical protein
MYLYMSDKYGPLRSFESRKKCLRKYGFPRRGIHSPASICINAMSVQFEIKDFKNPGPAECGRKSHFDACIE